MNVRESYSRALEQEYLVVFCSQTFALPPAVVNICGGGAKAQNMSVILAGEQGAKVAPADDG